MLKPFILLVLMAGLFAYNASTASYSLGSFHYGLVGGEGISANYNSTNTLTNQQAGNQNATSSHYSANYGWFNVSFGIVGVFLTLEADLSFINATAGHAFSASATVSDPLGGNHITSISITSTAGTCLPFSNSTSGINFTAVYVCLTTIPATTDITITFNDALIFSTISTSTLSNTYPDHPATLSNPVILPIPAFNDTNLTCFAGTFSDPDGDLGTNITWAWSVNGVILSGQNNQTLTVGNYNFSDTVRCYENASSTVWANSNGSAISNPAIIYSPPAGIYLEIVGLWLILCLAMFVLAEFSITNITLGITSSVMLVLMAVWMFGYPIVIHTSDTAVYTQNWSVDNSSVPLTNISYASLVKNQTNIYTYAPIYTPIFNFNEILAVVFAMVGCLMGLRYALKLRG